MQRSLSRLWLALMLLVTLVAAACGGGDGGEGGEKKEGQAAECSAEGLEAESAAAKGGDQTSLRLAQVDQPTKKTLVIGAFGDRTGGNSQLIVPSHNGAQLAIDQANAKGDLPVTLEFRPVDNKDAATNINTAIPIAQQFISDPSVIGVVGGGFSGETGATGGLFSSAGLLLISASATRVDLTEQGWKTFFRGLANDDDQGKAAAPLFEALNCREVAVINDKSAYGQGLTQVVVPALKDADIDVVLDEGIEPTTDYTALVDSVLAEDPQAVFYGGYSTEFQLLVRQLREKGYEGVIASGDGSKTATLGADIGKEAAEGVILLCPCGDPNVSDDPEAKEFAQEYSDAFKVQPEIYAAEGFDVANVIIEGIRACGRGGADAVTRQCVVDEVKKINYEGLTKTFKFTEKGQVTPGPIVVYVIRDAKITEVGPVRELRRS
jgi:branched-chain amino acid transport system substrate-binding protein